MQDGASSVISNTIVPREEECRIDSAAAAAARHQVVTHPEENVTGHACTVHVHGARTMGIPANRQVPIPSTDVYQILVNVFLRS